MAALPPLKAHRVASTPPKRDLAALRSRSEHKSEQRAQRKTANERAQLQLGNRAIQAALRGEDDPLAQHMIGEIQLEQAGLMGLPPEEQMSELRQDMQSDAQHDLPPNLQQRMNDRAGPLSGLPGGMRSARNAFHDMMIGGLDFGLGGPASATPTRSRARPPVGFGLMPTGMHGAMQLGIPGLADATRGVNGSGKPSSAQPTAAAGADQSENQTSENADKDVNVEGAAQLTSAGAAQGAPNSQPDTAEQTASTAPSTSTDTSEDSATQPSQAETAPTTKTRKRSRRSARAHGRRRPKMPRGLAKIYRELRGLSPAEMHAELATRGRMLEQKINASTAELSTKVIDISAKSADWALNAQSRINVAATDIDSGVDNAMADIETSIETSMAAYPALLAASHKSASAAITAQEAQLIPELDPAFDSLDESMNSTEQAAADSMSQACTTTATSIQERGERASRKAVSKGNRMARRYKRKKVDKDSKTAKKQKAKNAKKAQAAKAAGSKGAAQLKQMVQGPSQSVRMQAPLAPLMAMGAIAASREKLRIARSAAASVVTMGAVAAQKKSTDDTQAFIGDLQTRRSTAIQAVSDAKMKAKRALHAQVTKQRLAITTAAVTAPVTLQQKASQLEGQFQEALGIVRDKIASVSDHTDPKKAAKALRAVEASIDAARQQANQGMDQAGAELKASIDGSAKSVEDGIVTAIVAVGDKGRAALAQFEDKTVADFTTATLTLEGAAAKYAADTRTARTQPFTEGVLAMISASADTGAAVSTFKGALKQVESKVASKLRKGLAKVSSLARGAVSRIDSGDVSVSSAMAGAQADLDAIERRGRVDTKTLSKRLDGVLKERREIAVDATGDVVLLGRDVKAETDAALGGLRGMTEDQGSTLKDMAKEGGGKSVIEQLKERGVRGHALDAAKAYLEGDKVTGLLHELQHQRDSAGLYDQGMSKRGMEQLVGMLSPSEIAEIKARASEFPGAAKLLSLHSEVLDQAESAGKKADLAWAGADKAALKEAGVDPADPESFNKLSNKQWGNLMRAGVMKRDELVSVMRRNGIDPERVESFTSASDPALQQKNNAKYGQLLLAKLEITKSGAMAESASLMQGVGGSIEKHGDNKTIADLQQKLREKIRGGTLSDEDYQAFKKQVSKLEHKAHKRFNNKMDNLDTAVEVATVVKDGLVEGAVGLARLTGGPGLASAMRGGLKSVETFAHETIVEGRSAEDAAKLAAVDGLTAAAGEAIGGAGSVVTRVVGGAAIDTVGAVGREYLTHDPSKGPFKLGDSVMKNGVQNLMSKTTGEITGKLMPGGKSANKGLRNKVKEFGTEVIKHNIETSLEQGHGALGEAVASGDYSKVGKGYVDGVVKHAKDLATTKGLIKNVGAPMVTHGAGQAAERQNGRRPMNRKEMRAAQAAGQDPHHPAANTHDKADATSDPSKADATPDANKADSPDQGNDGANDTPEKKPGLLKRAATLVDNTALTVVQQAGKWGYKGKDIALATGKKLGQWGGAAGNKVKAGAKWAAKRGKQLGGAGADKARAAWARRGGRGAEDGNNHAPPAKTGQRIATPQDHADVKKHLDDKRQERDEGQRIATPQDHADVKPHLGRVRRRPRPK
ncbi:MAG: hypothetical protein ACI9MC_000611, partial [Kiritimatiellia bacterium]